MESEIIISDFNAGILKIEKFCEDHFSENSCYEAQYGVLSSIIIQSFEHLEKSEEDENSTLKVWIEKDSICIQWLLNTENFIRLKGWLNNLETKIVSQLWNRVKLNIKEQSITFYVLNQGLKQSVYQTRISKLRNYFSKKTLIHH